MAKPLPRIFLSSAILLCAGCSQSSLDCTNENVGRTISNLFRRQLKLTPYLRFIDIDKAELTVGAIFTTASDATSTSCVAFVKYSVKLNEEGQRLERKDQLLYSLLYELGNEKQIYYRVRRVSDGHVEVHIDRIGG